MRIPSQRVGEYLTPGPIPVMKSDYSCLDAAMPYTHALAMAARGEVEAIATKAGRVKYLRLLTDGERPRLVVEEIPLETLTKPSRSSSAVVARTNMGVYRQEVESKRLDEFGLPTKIIIGHVWAHCGLRRQGI